MTDNELRKLIPDLLRCLPIGGYPNGARYTREELDDHALATARVVWAAAIERDSMDAKRWQFVAQHAFSDTPDEALVNAKDIDEATALIDASIRPIGSRETQESSTPSTESAGTSRTLSFEGE